MVAPNMAIEALVYVDDIGSAGSKENMEVIGENMRKMEIEKRFTFSTGKSNYMRIRTGRNKTTKAELTIEVKRGKVEKTEEYKYLGGWMNQKGNLERQIEEIERKALIIGREAERITKEEDLGRLSTEGTLTLTLTLIYEKTCGCDVWTKIGKEEWKKMEKIQGRLLKKLIGVLEQTPTWGILKEVGIWLLEDQVGHQRLMLLQSLMTSENGRLGKWIIKAQKEREIDYGWYAETQKIGQKYRIEVDEVENMTKRE